ncbi:transporter substrate-binding domain-containing protein [Streptosporangium sp. NPDC006007]|uniref:transporter substrate-binding domain-containing protein n=1 Tax=Streptosporangium sp. NPDC006007 TaxID=3154575 RepID=UPI0033AB1C22
MAEEPVDAETPAEEPTAPVEDHGSRSGPPPESTRTADRARPYRMRRFRLLAWIALVLAAVVVGASVLWVRASPTEAELWEQARLIGKDKLRIGVKGDIPGISYRERSGSDVFTGFEIDIARMIAADLGFPSGKVEFLPIETEDRARMMATDGKGKPVKVDLVISSFSVTPDREKKPAIGFSMPYLYTEQSVITRSGYLGNITSLGQLKDMKVCTLGTSTSEQELAKATKATVTGKNLLSDCVAGLKDDEFDAVTTDAALLAGFVNESLKSKETAKRLKYHDIALDKDEMWAVNVGPNKALRTLVNLSLYRSCADPHDQRWEKAYEKHIGSMFPDVPPHERPPMGVAQPEQPCGPPPEVRRWPWERTFPVREGLSR